jgi:type IV secretion system protein VirD4
MGRTWYAFRVMLDHARRDPLWALGCIIVGPLRLGVHALKVFFFSALVTLVLLALVEIGMEIANLKKTVVHAVLNISASLVGFAFLLRAAFYPMVETFGHGYDDVSDSHGSARFATKQERLPLAVNSSGLLIGRDPDTGSLLRYAGPAHLLTMAPTRTGKGVGTIIPNLLTLDRSILCIDPKGENAVITAKARDRFGAVHIIDPFGVTGLPSSAFNPLGRLDPEHPDAMEDANALAEALVQDAPGETGEAHWNEEAKALLSGLILQIAAAELAERRNLSTLRECLTLAPEAFSDLLKRMQQSQDAHGLVARAANRHLGKADREAAGVLSTAQRHTHFLDSPRMGAVLSRSDFAFADLKHRTTTIFLVLPPDRLETYARWLRLMLTAGLTAMAREPSQSREPVLFLLDEFASLGRLPAIERAMGLMAGYGLQLWPILQDIHQLRATYGPRAGTFLSNAGVLQIFGVNDHETARLVSDLLGNETIQFQTMSRALDATETGITYATHQTGRPLLTPDEVRGLNSEMELLFLAGSRPVLAQKLRYYADREFAGLVFP